MAAEQARLLSLAVLPDPQDRRAVRAKDWGRHGPCRWLHGVECLNTDAPGLRVVPQPGADAVPVPKLDLLAEVHPGDDFRQDFGREAERGKGWFEVDGQSAGDDLAGAVAVLRELEVKLLVPVEEHAGVAVVLPPLLRHRAGKFVHLLGVQPLPELLLKFGGGNLAVLPLPPRRNVLLDERFDPSAPLLGVHPQPQRDAVAVDYLGTLPVASEDFNVEGFREVVERAGFLGPTE